jgi:hypothetical protein
MKKLFYKPYKNYIIYSVLENKIFINKLLKVEGFLIFNSLNYCFSIKTFCFIQGISRSVSNFFLLSR